MFSNSGNTIELVNLIPLFKEIGIKVVGICCNKDSKFNEYCDNIIVTPYQKEISGVIDKIQTNSFMSHLLFSNILVSLLKNRIDLNSYRQNHLSGNIGKNLLKVKDLLIKEYPKFIINNNKFNININIILLKMTEYKIGYCFFVTNDKKLIGILTDHDTRKLIISGKNNIQINNINRNYQYIDNVNIYIKDLNKSKFILPVIEKNIFKGIIINNF